MPKSMDAGAAISTIGGGVIVTVNDPVPVHPLAAVACTVKVNAPAAVGVPASTPGSRSDNPAGTAPLETVKANGPSLPDAASEPEYGTPVNPFGSVPETVMTGHAPTPASATLRVVPVDVVMSSDALFTPADAGWNATGTVVLAPPSIVVAAGAPAPNSVAFAPVMTNGGVSETPVASVFAIVIVADALDPGVTVPKSMLVGDTDSPPVPVPLSGTLIVPPLELVTTSAALFAPLSAGWNVTAIVAVPRPAIVVVDGAPAENAAASAPEIDGAFNVTVPSSWFLIETASVRASPGATGQKSTLAGDAVSTMFCGLLGEVSWKSAVLSFVSWSVGASPPGLRS